MSKAEPVLTFDPVEHRYFINGQPRGSVTQIMEDVRIIDYSGLPEDVRVNSLERGRIVHEITEMYDRGELDEDSVDPRLSGFFGAHKNFRRESGMEPELIEHRGYNLALPFLPEASYCGTLDRVFVARYRGRKVLVDIKTGRAPWWVRIQLAAYAPFFANPRLYERWCVVYHRDGTYEMIGPFPGTEWMRDFNVFLSALNVYNEKRLYAAGRKAA